MKRLLGRRKRLSIGFLFIVVVMALGVACTGDAGVAGSVGPAGSQGAAGPAGSQGAAGLAGAPGDTGPSGQAGTSGAAGSQGPGGATGQAGAQGPTGPAGSSLQIATVVNAPVVPDGTVADSSTEFVINLGVSMDPNIPGKSLLEGKTIKITLPDDFGDSGSPLFQGVGTENCTPGNLQCTTAVLLQGWPQHPIGPPFLKYDVSLEGSNTIVFTALEDIVAQPPLAPGIKQLHLILKRFTNPGPGQYGIKIEAETGPNGELEFEWGQLHIIPQTRPSISVTSAFNSGTPNTIYQDSAPGETTPLQYDLLLWNSEGAAMEGVTISELEDGIGTASHVGNLVQNERVVGNVFVDAPEGATGQDVFTDSPSVEISAPITGVPTAHLVAFFKSGSTPGNYIVTFKLIGGNSIQMFVAVR